MRKKRIITKVIVCLFVFVSISCLVSADNNDNNFAVPLGHFIEKDSSKIKLMNTLKSITQARNAVVGNITNAQTTSYKRNLVRFIDRNTVVICRDFSQGNLVQTYRSFDIAIDGNGFIGVEDSNGKTFYTRCGALQINSHGQLFLVGGYHLEASICFPSEVTDFRVGRDGIVSYNNSDDTETECGQICLHRFPNEEALSYDGSGLYSKTDRSGDPMEGIPGEDGLGKVIHGFLESSNVNENEELRILKELNEFENQINEALEIVSTN